MAIGADIDRGRCRSRQALPAIGAALEPRRAIP
jgi:hypothetical protein